MKVKQSPDDFQVEELTAVTPGADGAFAFYRMEKRGWATPDAFAAVLRRWKLEGRRLSYGGLKDRHAATAQYFTIFHGPRRNLQHHEVRVEYLGQVREAYTSHRIRANRFRIVLRDISGDERPAMEERLRQVAALGLPNYFDDQRFGSVTDEGGEFIGRLLVRGRFEEALRLALAAAYEHDRAAQKEEKRVLNEHWGDWATCKEKLPRGHARSLVDYLRVHPGDFKGAVARLRPELRGLYLSAFQSHLWNRILARWLRDNVRPELLRPVSLRLGDVPIPAELDAAAANRLEKLRIPLPSARLKLDGGHPAAAATRAVLAEEGLELRDLQVRGVREMFFSKGERPALCRPRSLEWSFADDEKHPPRLKLEIAFDLPRGSYATLLVKAVTQHERTKVEG
jgi:tRNA pseudouridine13 synthase